MKFLIETENSLQKIISKSTLRSLLIIRAHLIIFIIFSFSNILTPTVESFLYDIPKLPFRHFPIVDTDIYSIWGNWFFSFCFISSRVIMESCWCLITCPRYSSWSLPSSFFFPKNLWFMLALFFRHFLNSAI